MKSESKNSVYLRNKCSLDIISRMQPYCDNMIAFQSVSSWIQSTKPLFTSKAVFSGFFIDFSQGMKRSIMVRSGNMFFFFKQDFFFFLSFVLFFPFSFEATIK